MKRRVATERIPGSGEIHTAYVSPIHKVTGRHHSVSAVVSFSANYANAFCCGIVRDYKVGYRRAGIFHESQRWNTEALSGNAVNFAHFGGGDDFHERDAAIRSNWRS